MARIELDRLSAIIDGQHHGCSVSVGDVAIDSRRVNPGELFWALPGSRTDGCRFVDDAFARGAAACVVRDTGRRRWPGPVVTVADSLAALWDLAGWHRSRLAGTVIAVTGSVGKTTTRELIHAAPAGVRRGSRSPQNFNNQVGVPLSLLSAEVDDEFVVLELGASAPGEIARLARLVKPRIGVVTLLAPAHLEGFGSIEAVRHSKAELLRALPSDGLAILAGGIVDPQLLADGCRCRSLRAGTAAGCDLLAEDLACDGRTIGFRIDGDRFSVPLAGRHFVDAAVSAVAVADALGVARSDAARGLASVVPPRGRCTVRKIGSWTVIDDTYNASPASLSAACRLLGEFPEDGRRVLVLGEMAELGPAAAGYHRQAGAAAAAAGVDLLFACGRFASDVCNGARLAGLDQAATRRFQELGTLWRQLTPELEAGDVILVKGSRAARMERLVEWMCEMRSAKCGVGS